MKLETSRKSKRSLHWCRSISKKYLCTFYYSISQKVITLSGRRFITVSGVLLHYRAVITLSGVFYYIIGQLLQYRAFITLSVGTGPAKSDENAYKAYQSRGLYPLVSRLIMIMLDLSHGCKKPEVTCTWQKPTTETTHGDNPRRQPTRHPTETTHGNNPRKQPTVALLLLCAWKSRQLIIG